jgi:DNA-directed RNA polymerase subunit RPC12/RpoP
MILVLASLEASILEEKSIPETSYECVRCTAKVSSKELALRGGRVKCTFCGYRVLKKIRSPIVKRVSAK